MPVEYPKPPYPSQKQPMPGSTADLTPLETGEVRVGECISDGDWHDITPAAISSQKRIISTLESMLNVLHP
jgi:hypothetical protein